MRKILILFLITSSIFLTSCRSNGHYDRGYQDGYEAGYIDGSTDTRLEMVDDYVNGYGDGYDDAVSIIEERSYPGDLCETAIEIIRNVKYEANEYAMSESEYDTETAMAIVQSYLNNEPDIFGDTYTYEEFTDAVITLYRFYEYFYCNEYK